MAGGERDRPAVAAGDPSGPARPPGPRDLVESLHALALLRDLDALTEAEYQRAKEMVVERRRLAGSQS